jgi:hypothetical protein
MQSVPYRLLRHEPDLQIRMVAGVDLNDRPLRLWVHETLYLKHISRTCSFSGNISPDRYREKALVVVLFPDGRLLFLNLWKSSW